MLQILHKTNINFMGWKNISFTVSAIMITLGIIALVQIGRGKANLGIDFVGGTTIQLSFKEPGAHRQGPRGARQERFPGRLHSAGGRGREQDPDQAAGIGGRFRQGPDHVPAGVPEQSVRGLQHHGDRAGDRQGPPDAVTWAITISIIGIVIYIAFRFQFKFGVAAAIATIHDVCAVLAIFYLLHMEINLLVITALLTLAGYSLTDTVVVFDRIRENLRKNKQDPLPKLVNDSINEVLSRTLITSLTVVLVLVPLVDLRGRGAARFFSGAAHGRVVGTYSSIFVASPILVVWQAKSGGRLTTK